MNDLKHINACMRRGGLSREWAKEMVDARLERLHALQARQHAHADSLGTAAARTTWSGMAGPW